MRLALAATLLFSLVESGAARAQPVVLWHAYDGAEAAAIQQIVESFESTNPGIDVRVLAVPFAAYSGKLESSIPTGEGPDLFIDAHERLTDYIAGRLIQPVPGGAGVVDRFQSIGVESLRANGELYAWPLSIKCAALYVNNDLVPNPLNSLDEIVALRAALPEDIYPLAFELHNAYYVAAILHAFGGQLLGEDGTYEFQGAAAERTLSLLRRWARDRIVPSEVDYAKMQRLFESGHAAAVITGPWFAPNLPPSLNYRVIALPPLEGHTPRPFATIEGVFLSSEARDPEAASALAMALVGPSGSAVRARIAGQVPLTAESVPLTPLAEMFAAAARDAVPMPAHPKMKRVFEPAGEAIRRAVRGELTPAASLEASALFFADITRDPPPPADSMPFVLGLGLALAALLALSIHRLRKPEMRSQIRRSLPAYRYIAHAFLAVFVLVLAPLLVGAGTAFFAGRGTDMYFVGGANFVDILTARGGDLLASRSFYLVLLVTVLWTAANLALHLALGVGLGILLHRPTMRLRGAYRVLLILPWAVPNYVTALAWRGLFDFEYGAVNSILNALGAESVHWFSQWTTAFAANLTTNVWLGFPFMMVVTMGALSAIPNELHEAAEVDGATALQRFRGITWPLLKPMLAPAVAMGAIWTFNMFNVVFLVSGGEPSGRTEILVSEAYRWAFTRGHQYGYAAAYAVLIFGILILSTYGLGRRLGSERAA